MKNWNITQLNFSNEEYKKLCAAYGKILIIAAQIDGDVNEKEIDTIISLIVRTPIRIEDRNFFREINHIDIEKETIINDYRVKNNYLQVFEIENLVLFEIERNMDSFIKALTDQDLIDRIEEEKIEDLKNNLQIIKTILESKKDIIGKEYIQSVYEGLYDYVEKITKKVGKGFFIRKTGKEEKILLETIKNELAIKGDIRQKYIAINRHNHILFD